MNFFLPSVCQVISNVIVHFGDNLLSGNTKVPFNNFSLFIEPILLVFYYITTIGHSQIILKYFFTLPFHRRPSSDYSEIFLTNNNYINEQPC